MGFSLQQLFVAGVVASLATFADAHSALLSNGKLLGQLNSGECFNCAVGSYPVPANIPASAVNDADPEDGIAAYIKSSGATVKDTWNAFHAGTPYGGITEPEAIQPGTCGRFSPTAVGDVPAGAKISYKKSNHNGPAEIWVDDEKVWTGDNFIRDGKSIKADLFKCSKASCQVHWYWMGKVQVKGKWNYYQLYVQCFVIKGSGSGGAAPVSPAATPKAGDSGDDEKPGTVAPSPAKGDQATDGSDSKEARRVAKEKRRADKAAAKAAKENAKDKQQNLRA
jgi:hypothetical protein